MTVSNRNKILSEYQEESYGESVRRQHIQAGREMADAVRSTLGPNGMDKLLVPPHYEETGQYVVTNDGATIVEEMKWSLEHPSANMIKAVSQQQAQTIGDGTTTVIVLAGALLDRAEKLIRDGLHPTTVVSGYQRAARRATETVDAYSEPALESDLALYRSLAATAMSGRIGENHSETLAELVVEGLHRTGRDRFDRDRLQVMAIGGDTISESELVDGVMIDKERVNFNLPDSVSDATVALVNGALEAEFEDDEHQLRVERADDVSAFEQRKREIAAEQIAPYVDAGVDALFVSTFLDDYHQVHLVRDGTFAVRQMDLEDIHKIAAATGATVRDPLEPLRTDDLGYASHIAEIGFGDERRIRVESEGQDESVTLLLRGGTDHSLMELERTVEDAVSVVCTVSADGRIVPGAGACELSLASELRSYARSVDDRSQLAIEQFAEALETIPKTLARNAGVDVTDTLIDLRNEHERGNDSVGVAADGTTFDACEAGLIEPARLKDGVINGATEVTTQLLRADGVIATEPLSDDESDEILERVEQGEDPEEAVDNVRN